MLIEILEIYDVACFLGLCLDPKDLFRLSLCSRFANESILKNIALIRETYLSYYGHRLYLDFILEHDYIKDKERFIRIILKDYDIWPKQLLRKISMMDFPISNSVISFLESRNERFQDIEQNRIRTAQIFDCNNENFNGNASDEFDDRVFRMYFIDDKNALPIYDHSNVSVMVTRYYIRYGHEYLKYLVVSGLTDSRLFQESFHNMTLNKFYSQTMETLFRIYPIHITSFRCFGHVWKEFKSRNWISFSAEELIFHLLCNYRLLNFHDILSLLQQDNIFNEHQTSHKLAAFKSIIRYPQNCPPLSDSHFELHRCMYSRDSSLFTFINDYATSLEIKNALTEYFDTFSATSEHSVTEHQLCFLMLLIYKRLSNEDQSIVFRQMLSAFVRRKLKFAIIFVMFEDHCSKNVANGLLSMDEEEQQQLMEMTILYHLNSLSFSTSSVIPDRSPYYLIFNLPSSKIRLASLINIARNMKLDESKIKKHKLNDVLSLITKTAFRDRWKASLEGFETRANGDFMNLLRILLNRYEQNAEEKDSYQGKYLDILIPLINKTPTDIDSGILSEIIYWAINTDSLDTRFFDPKKIKKHTVWFFWEKFLISICTTSPTDQKWKSAFQTIVKVLKTLQDSSKALQYSFSQTQVAALHEFELDLSNRVKSHKKFST